MHETFYLLIYLLKLNAIISAQCTTPRFCGFYNTKYTSFCGKLNVTKIALEHY